jgi:hypothetical protein
MFVPLRELLKTFPEAEQRHLNTQLKRLGTQLEQVSAAALAEPAA